MIFRGSRILWSGGSRGFGAGPISPVDVPQSIVGSTFDYHFRSGFDGGLRYNYGYADRTYSDLSRRLRRTACSWEESTRRDRRWIDVSLVRIVAGRLLQEDSGHEGSRGCEQPFDPPHLNGLELG